MLKQRTHLSALGTVLLAVLLMLSGCATMNEEECRSANWYSIGFEDGAKGRPVGYIGRHREACSEYGISPDAQGYQQGWDEGLLRYCTPQNAYHAGLRGQRVQVQCPLAQRTAFHSAYEYGRRIHLVESELSTLNRDVRATQQELEGVQHELERIDRQLVRAGMSEIQHNRMLAQLRQLYRRESILEAQLARLNKAQDKSKTKRSPPPKTKPEPQKKPEPAIRPKPETGRPKALPKDEERGKQRESEKGKDKEKNEGKGNGKDDVRLVIAKSSDVKGNEKRSKALAQELAAVRQNIQRLELQLGRNNRQHEKRWRLLQQSRELSQQEGALQARLYLLERDQRELEQHIHQLKQYSPY